MAVDIYPFLSDLEKIIYVWLVKNNVLFNTQQRFGGYMDVGSGVVDFILPENNIALRVMGSYWHHGLKVEGRDALGREMLTAAGYIVVDVAEEGLRPDRLEHTMRAALRGEEVSYG